MIQQFSLSKVGFAASLTLLIAPGLFAQAVPIASGRTTIDLNPLTLSILQAFSVTTSVGGAGRLDGNLLSFPITQGDLDPASLKGEIQHAGSLVLKVGDTKVELANFTVDLTGSTPALTALVLVNGSLAGRVPVFDLKPSADLKLPLTPRGGALVEFGGVAVSLSNAGAAALNQSVGSTSFIGGISLGTASVRALIDADAIPAAQ